MNSRKKNAIEYSLDLFVKELFQQSKMQVGINNAVNWIKIKAKPSIPMITFILNAESKAQSSKNWNWVEIGSKKKSKEILKFSIINDQKSAKLRIKFSSVFEIKSRTKQPKSGRKIKKDNI